MANIQLTCDKTQSDTLVSNRFLDEYMPDANGEFVKIYLYLLRCIGSSNYSCSVSAIADRFNHTEKDVIRALLYWERKGLLSIEYDASKSICGIRIAALTPVVSDNDTTKDVIVAEEKTEKKNYKNDQTVIPQRIKDSTEKEIEEVQTSFASYVKPVENAKTKEYTLDEIKKFRDNPEVSELIFIVEAYLKKPLSTTDINTLLYWYDELDFTGDLIEYLVEYCITKGHSSFRYMDKVAIGWSENGVKTVEQAKDNAAIHSKVYYAVMKAFGIAGRNLNDVEIGFISKWTKDYAFDIDLIDEACKRTIKATHQPSFEYADRIMTNWHEGKVHNLTDVERMDDNYNKTKKIKIQTTENKTSLPRKNTFTNINHRNYDNDELEKVLLASSVQ